MAVTIDYAARFQAGTLLRKSGSYGNTVDQCGLRASGRLITAFPIYKGSNEIVNSLTFKITKNYGSANSGNGANFSWFIGLLDQKLETTDTVAVGDQVIAAFEKCIDKCCFAGFNGSTGQTTNTITIDNINWSQGTTKYVYVFNSYYSISTTAYFTFTNITLESYSLASSAAPEVLRMPPLGQKSGADSKWINTTLYVGYALSNGSPLYGEGVYQFYTPSIAKDKVDHYSFSFNVTSLPNYSSNPVPKTIRWAITPATTNISLYNNKVGAVTNDSAQVATGTFSIPALGVVTFDVTGVQLNPSTQYYIIVWGEGPGYTGYCSFGTLEGHGFKAYYKTQYTISFKNNGGSGTMSNMIKEHGTSLTLPSNSFTSPSTIEEYYQITFHTNSSKPIDSRECSRITSYSFLQWRLNSPTGTIYAIGSSYTIDQDAVFYAEWKTTEDISEITLEAAQKDNTLETGYVVTLNGNGIDSISQMTSTKDRSYTFESWNTNSNGSGNTYYADSSYFFNQNTDLYALYTTNDTPNAIYLPTPQREDYLFKGWANSATAESGIKGKYTPHSNITLYAIWKPRKITFVKSNGIWKTK